MSAPIDTHAPADFSDTEVQAFHADDRKAGAAIIILVTSIFGIGIVLYTIVAIWCM